MLDDAVSSQKPVLSARLSARVSAKKPDAERHCERCNKGGSALRGPTVKRDSAACFSARVKWLCESGSCDQGRVWNDPKHLEQRYHGGLRKPSARSSQSPRSARVLSAKPSTKLRAKQTSFRAFAELVPARHAWRLLDTGGHATRLSVWQLEPTRSARNSSR